MRTLSSLQHNGFRGKCSSPGRRRTWAWGSLAVVALGVGGWSVSSLLAQSVVYYRTPSEVAHAGTVGPGGTDGTDGTGAVRLAGSLVSGSVTKSPGSTTFDVTDGVVTISVRYGGPPSAALSTGAKPGSQVVAEGSMGADGVFHADQLMAKCPSKYSSGG
jgi:cytochrome c-type biogenesis protein CcmE